MDRFGSISAARFDKLLALRLSFLRQNFRAFQYGPTFHDLATATNVQKVWADHCRLLHAEKKLSTFFQVAFLFHSPNIVLILCAMRILDHRKLCFSLDVPLPHLMSRAFSVWPSHCPATRFVTRSLQWAQPNPRIGRRMASLSRSLACRLCRCCFIAPRTPFIARSNSTATI